MSLKKYLNIYKRYKALVLSIVALIVILLPVVLILSQGVEIASKLKAYHYIGAGIQNKNTITVAGEGKIYTKPDVAFVSLSVVSEGRRITDVQNDNTKKVNKVIDFLKQSNVEEKDIKTTTYNLYPQYNYENVRIPEIVGYRITQTLEVKIRSLGEVGDILEGSINSGVNQINSLYFQVDDDEALKAQARELAISDAKEKANELASQLGVRLLKISGYSENFSGAPIFRGYAEGIGGGGGPQIEIGESEIVIGVNVTYEIN